MATSYTPIPTISPTPSSSQTQRITTASASGKWRTPLFGLPSDPDYIHNPKTPTDGPVTETSDLGIKSNQCRSRFSPGCFTEEKAKQLLMKTVETVNFHDIMYHSAIASRLASDVSGYGDR